MATKHFALRLDEAVAEQLELRATIERRSVNEIIGEAIAEYFQSHPICRTDMLILARAIAKEDAPLLKGLADA
ncbi:MAG: hypothetical protein QOD51_2451 [Candidatus Eremiobacteraeota bacterium]|jgi:hypothetical protein|nr:hypothetical protein [Candidatus Eremiobacteraeota bacterium]